MVGFFGILIFCIRGIGMEHTLKRIQIFSGSALKNIAVITMLIDHMAAAVVWNVYIHPNIPIVRGTRLYNIYVLYQAMRAIGRCAFPIFCFMLVEGFQYTHDRKRYAMRLLIFALISEIPFDLALNDVPFYMGHQNVIFTLLLGLLMMMTWEKIGVKFSDDIVLSVFLQVSSTVGWCLIAYLTNVDYSYRGMILILVFYLFRRSRIMQIAAGALAMAWEWPAVFSSFGLLLLYNGKKGKGHKYFFYIFYPAHLFLLYLLTQYLL